MLSGGAWWRWLWCSTNLLEKVAATGHHVEHDEMTKLRILVFSNEL